MARKKSQANDTPSFASQLETAGHLIQENKFLEAISIYKTVLQAEPDNTIALSNLGTVLRTIGNLEGALICAKKAINLAPNHPPHLTNYGNVLTDLDKREEALAAHAKAYQITPNDFLIHKNYAASLREFCQFEHAMAHYKAASALQPKNDNIKWDIAITHLHMGQFIEGWPAFEVRWKIGEMPERPQTAQKWQGETLQGKTILIHGEQGFGDTILCSRYIPMVKAKGGRVIFECKPQLHKIISKIEGIDKIAGYGETTEHFDYQIPIMSLPGIFGTNLSNIPSTPELFVPQQLPSNAKKLLDAAKGKLKVGIVWSGSLTFKGNRKRAVSLERFMPLANVPGVQLFSLQKGPCEKELYAANADPFIWDLSGDLNDFTDTAAIIRELDLVIMTDSSVAHLAGSLGTPIWNLLNYKPYWLYLNHREDCPWYPSMRLLRQNEPGEWDTVFNKVSIELEKAAILKKAGLWEKYIVAPAKGGSNKKVTKHAA